MTVDESLKNLEVLEGIISYHFINRSLLLQAMTHTSYLNENPGWPVSHYERFEFLGDTVLQMIITEMLFKQYPHDAEGNLSVKRSVIVRKNMLSDIAKVLNLERFILIGNSEKNQIGSLSQSLLSDFVESLIASIYIDGGYEPAINFCRRYFQKLIDDVEQLQEEFNYKSNLQNFTQTNYHVLPEYRILEEKGPEHRKKYTVAVYVNGEEVAVGRGFSKKQAERKAARKALEKYKKD
ncbi:MAG: ribonuclease III [Candidatus Aureabacteria bacterium]|nr:ribonuclease III [Candidatus Auribacterota bacterium]